MKRLTFNMPALAALTALAPLAAILVLGATGSTGTAALAADHLDAPGLTPPGGDAALDITDVYAFASPDCDDCTVLIMAVNGLTAPGVDVAFDSEAHYRFRVDNNGNAVQDFNFDVRFSKVRRDGTQRFSVRMRGDTGRKTLIGKGSGRTTPVGEEAKVINGKEGLRAFAGMRDDPFFFDLPGFVALDFCATDPAADTFAGSNVAAIVLEVPNSLIGPGPALAVWGTTSKGGEQIDRKGRPAINTVFIPSNPINGGDSLKDAFNAGSPANDREDFRDTVIDTLLLLGNDAVTAGALADFLLPDVLTFTLGDTSGFPNGRRPNDDVIDTELGLITGGAIASDCVDKNDKRFPKVMPFLGKAHV